jgi:hypothetical protein
MEQLVLTTDIYHLLTGELAEDVARLSLGFWVNTLGELLPAYDQAVRAVRDKDFEFQTLAESRREDRRQLYQVIVKCFAHAIDHPEDEPMVEAMLAAYNRVAERYRAARGNRSSAPAVNPDTGELTNDEEESG